MLTPIEVQGAVFGLMRKMTTEERTLELVQKHVQNVAEKAGNPDAKAKVAEIVVSLAHELGL